jgi:hypothetical protein
MNQRTDLTPNELTAVTQTAETVAARYDFISKLEFLTEVKSLVSQGKNDIKTALTVWNRHYSD